MDMPVPMTGSVLELQFRRLLAKMEQVVLEVNMDTRRSSLKYHSYVDALQEQLADLENSKLANLTAETLELYKDRVQNVVRQLGPADAPAFCKPIANQDLNLEKVLKAANTVSESLQVPSLSTSHMGGGQADAGSGKEGGGPSFTIGKSTQATVARHRQLQDHLTDELVDMAAGLKSSAQAMRGAVHRRGDLLESTEVGLDKSGQNAVASAAAVKKQVQRSKWGCCFTFLVMLVVASVFTAMIAYIKLTHIMGYRAPPPTAQTPPPPAHPEL